MVVIGTDHRRSANPDGRSSATPPSRSTRMTPEKSAGGDRGVDAIGELVVADVGDAHEPTPTVRRVGVRPWLVASGHVARPLHRQAIRQTQTELVGSRLPAVDGFDRIIHQVVQLPFVGERLLAVAIAVGTRRREVANPRLGPRRRVVERAHQLPDPALVGDHDRFEAGARCRPVRRCACCREVRHRGRARGQPARRRCHPRGCCRARIR